MVSRDDLLIIYQELNVGEELYCNTLGFSGKAIETLRTLIKTGCITPSSYCIDKAINPEERYKFYTGESILPQCDFIKLK